MKRFSQQFNTKAEAVKMTVAEKRALRERVVSYMEYHPLPKNSIPTPYANESLFSGFTQSKFWQVGQFMVPAVFVLMLGVSSVAEKSVPGDALYAVKQVNEDLRSTMMRGSYEKVVWETELLNRRMSEARELASEGRLTEAVEIEVAKAVQEHSENARREIETLKEIDEDEATLAAIELTTALSVQTTALQNQNAKTGASEETDLISEAVQVAAEALEQVTEDNDLPAYDKLVAKVESETTRARELLLSIADTATPEERGDVERRLSDIDLKITTAQAEVGTNEISARESLVLVLEQTHKLIVFMTNIDVREAVTVEEVVPVTLTESERLEKIETNTLATNTILAKVEEVLLATSTTSVIEVETLDKATIAVTLAKTALEQVSIALALDPKDLAAAEVAVTEAYSVVEDAARLLGIQPAEITGEVPQEIVPAVPGEPQSEEGEEVVPEIVEAEVESSSSTTEETAQEIE